MKDDTTNYQDLRTKVNQHLDQQAADIDDELQTQFALARRRALDAIPEKPAGYYRWKPVWLTGAITAAFLLLAVFWLMPSRQSPGEDLDSLIVLTSGDDIEMLENDPEFYVWLESEDLSGNG